jgi:hypothetical protein
MIMKHKIKALNKEFRLKIRFSSWGTTVFIAVVLVLFFSIWNVNMIEAKDGGEMKDYAENREILWLARIIYSETKEANEQVLVAWVARNRVETAFRGANTYHEVATAKRQFSGLNSSDAQYLHNISRSYESSGESWDSALKVAEAVYHSPGFLRPLSKTVRHFYSPRSTNIAPEWSADHKPVLVIKDYSKGKSVRFAFYDGIK